MVKDTFEGLVKRMVASAAKRENMTVGHSVKEDYIKAMVPHGLTEAEFVVVSANGGCSDDNCTEGNSVECAQYALHILLSCGECEACQSGCVEECHDPYPADSLTFSVE